MACDYAAIREDNQRRYGTDIGRIGPMLLADRYDDRTHFIFELLQNAEDALRRRPGWEGSRAVTFTLSDRHLRIAHYGKPFDKQDVHGICGIATSTKETDLTAIGRFGIGFKSVYAFTDRPEVHSCEEDFAIENFVWPIGVGPVPRLADETVFLLPLRSADDTADADIIRGFERLGSKTLLFLREIEEIRWRVDGGSSGRYARSKSEHLDKHIRRIRLVSEELGKPDAESAWLVFSREARTPNSAHAGYVEIAFSLVPNEKANGWSIDMVTDSFLVAFFPTVLETHLGFLVQGPYRTTPSRDNIPPNDRWNQRLIAETAGLLIEALRWLRDHNFLNANCLSCLPLDRTKFPEGSRFAPLFEAVRNSLKGEPLLPRFGTGHIPGAEAKLARTQELRELLSSDHLANLLKSDGNLCWLSGEITEDRTPELRQYLIHELSIAEVTPDMVVHKLDATFLQGQPDAWILKLYEFLNGLQRLHKRLESVPLIRLEDGSHVTPKLNGQPQAFLPSTNETSFPTVRRNACASEEAHNLLQSLGLTEPDLVDDVVRNVLPRYTANDFKLDADQYEKDIRRLIKAFGTDSKTQRDKLISALRNCPFVVAVAPGDGSKRMSEPGSVYLPTERLSALFAGVSGVLMVDDTFACLRGEDARDLLVATGAARYLQPVPVPHNWQRREQLRAQAGTTGTQSPEQIEDYSLRGLDSLLTALPALARDELSRRAELLWDALSDLEQYRKSAFSGKYSGRYRGQHKSCDFDAFFVELLNSGCWVPDDGIPQRPELVLFESLGWKTNPFLLSKVRFKPPIIELLAKEAGIEPAVLDLLKKLGVTSATELRARLGIKDNSETSTPSPSSRGTSPQQAAKPDGTSTSDTEDATTTAARAPKSPTNPATPDNASDIQSNEPPTGSTERMPEASAQRSFISYVAVHMEDEEPDPDGLEYDARMAIEERAIQAILNQEPNLQRTPVHNPGYDLLEANKDGTPVRWIEVKAMSGTLRDRPVGLSRTQFDWAQRHGSAYWLYVVENAARNGSVRIVRIQDPAGKVRTFTFDHGWLEVANVTTFDSIQK